MTPDWPAVIDWLRAHEWRYAKAAKHFGLPVDEVRTVGKAAREQGSAAPKPPTLARAREAGAEKPKPGSREELLQRLAETDGARLKALADPKGGTAYWKLHGVEAGLRAELRALDEEAGRTDEVGELDDDALVRELSGAAEAMPEAHLRAVVDVYLRRHRLRLERDETKIQIIGGDEEVTA